VGDAAFTSGAPFDQGAEGSSVLGRPAGWPGLTFAGDADGVHAKVVQVGLDAGLAVAAVGGYGAGWFTGPAGDAADGRGELRRVGRVALLDGVVDDDAVAVVDDLRLVAVMPISA
jgi:hypothetical protein